jgi:hypothetical protein
MPLRLRAAFICQLIVASMALPAAPAAAQGKIQEYKGICDASAAVAAGPNAFVVASDEDNTLRLYSRADPQPRPLLDLGAHLKITTGREADIEGAAAIGDRIYWIASHGRNKEGKERRERQRFFATALAVSGTTVSLTPVGQAYANLLKDLIEAPQLKPYGLEEASNKAPEADGGLNIEGLAEGENGRLLIGFRNPVRNGKALLVPLENPQEVVQGASARLGNPIDLDLGGKGIRSIERIGAGHYLIVAGASGDGGGFALHRWSGRPADSKPPRLGVDLGTLRPEAMFAVPGTDTIQLLSDDGGFWADKCDKLPPGGAKFRGTVVKP